MNITNIIQYVHALFSFVTSISCLFQLKVFHANVSDLNGVYMFYVILANLFFRRLIKLDFGFK
jgi:hypothetical protein